MARHYRGMASIKTLLVALLLSVALGAGGAVAGQDDPRLDGLFDRLGKTSNRAEASAITNQIWGIWLRYDGSATEMNEALNRGIAQMRDRAYAKAEESFSAAIAADESFAEAWNKRATLRYLAGDLDGSILDIRQTLAREPRHFGALWGLGMIYSEMGELDLAKSAFESLLDLVPSDSATRELIREIEEKLADQNI